MWLIYLILIICLILLIFSKVILNFLFGKRCEGNPNLKYFTADDFEELENKEIEFKSNKGQIIRGYIYTNKNIENYKGLIVFVHGMGAGHLSYTTEINTLAKDGFKVLSYDNTGTCRSEGNSLVGFYQAVIDLKHALNYIKENDELNKYDVTLVGHSWGAFTVCQVLKYNYNIKKVVALSGPNNVDNIICDFMGGGKINCGFLKPFLKLINFMAFGKDALDNTSDVLKNTNVPVLLMHGDKDATCLLTSSLLNKPEIYKENVKTILYKDRFHNVYQTKESEQYLNEVFGNIAKINKEYKGKENLKEKLSEIYENIDYKKITEEDENVMKEIINFIN